MFGARSALRFARPTIILIDKLHRLRTPIRGRVLESKMNVIAQAGVEKLFDVIPALKRWATLKRTLMRTKSEARLFTAHFGPC